jgi:hypothetical protein
MSFYHLFAYVSMKNGADCCFRSFSKSGKDWCKGFYGVLENCSAHGVEQDFSPAASH